LFKKEKNNIPADFYGPFVRVGKKDKWHSSKQCSDYPKTKDLEIKFFSVYPEMSQMCIECVELEKKTLSKGKLV
jgi:hypothetical protein